MVRIRHHPCRHAPGLIPADTVHIHQNPHQLRDNQGRMGIVDMQRHFVRQGFNRSPGLAECPQYTLQTCTAQEVLLLQPEQLAFVLRIIRIQEF
ncbi:hypothetical protein D3C74_442830 [compost metagenome]